MVRSVSLGLFFVFVPAGLAQDKGKAAPIDKPAEAAVRKAIEAHGGKDALARHASTKFTIKGSIAVGPAANPFTGVVTTSAPGKYRLEMEAVLDRQKYSVTQVVNGSNVKSNRLLNGLPLSKLTEPEQEELVTAAAVQEANQLLPLLDPKRFTLKSIPDEEVDGKPAAGVAATLVEAKKEVKLFFDRDTGRLVKTSRRSLGPGDNGPVEVVQDAVMTGFKPFDGVQVATAVRVSHDGKPFMTIDVTAYARVEKPDPKLFDTDG